MSLTLNDLIATEQPVLPLEGWHAVLGEGFDCAVVTELAKAVKVSDKQLRAIVCPGVRFGKNVRLSRGASERLYRFASALVKHHERTGQGAAVAAAWLFAAQPTLRGRVPAELLTTTQGSEYVEVAISRI